MIDHPILGRVTRDQDHGLAKIIFGSRSIEVQIIPDDQTFDTTLALAATVVVGLNTFDEIAKRIIVAELRTSYNNGWNEYDEAQADGTLKAVVNPQLSEEEFVGKFSLRAINVTGNDVVDFFYDDSGLFWGHSVIVTSDRGADFSDAYSQLFG